MKQGCSQPHPYLQPLGEPRPRPSLRVKFHPRVQHLPQSTLPWLRAAPQPSPVEADLVETLFARLVDGVEAGARVLFFAAVWGRVGQTGGSLVRSGSPRTLTLPRYPHKSSTQWVA